MKKTVLTITFSAALLGAIMAPIEVGAGNQNGGEAKKKSLIVGGAALVAGGLTIAYANRNVIADGWLGSYFTLLGDLEHIKYLVEHGGVVKLPKRDWRPLMAAAYHGNLAIVKYLVEYGENVHMADDDYLTPLHLACMNDHLEIVKYLIERGANVDELADKGYNGPLQSAVDHGKVRIAKYLIENGANLDAKEKCTGDTILHTAVKVWQLDLVKCLVEHGANVAITNTNGATAHTLAVTKGYLESAAYLALVEDFYQVLKKTMAFDAFIKKYFEIQDQTLKLQNITDVRNLLQLGTKQLAGQFYGWLKKNGAFVIGDNWAKGAGFIYFDFFKKTLARDKRLFWYSNAAEYAKLNNELKLQDELKHARNQPGNTQLKADFELQCGMHNIAPKKLMPDKQGTKKNLYDCKIFFKK